MTWVVVEAKVGHTLTVEQIEGYANRRRIVLGCWWCCCRRPDDLRPNR